MAESYLFNPTEGINKAASQTQAVLGNIFTGIIAQKQNDYNIAEKTFENINALTDKLGEYGQEEITSKTTSLLDDAAKSIIKNGKVDYAQIGRIRNGVSTIKNRKSAIEAGTQMYKEMAQTALATKDDLLSLGVTLDGMRSVILNPENLSAEDMGRQMQAVYQKNVNTSKVFNDMASRIAPTQTYEQTYIKDGANYGVAGKKVGDYVLDPTTGKFTAPANVQAKNPDGSLVFRPDGDPQMIPYSSQKFNDFMQAGGASVLDAIRKQLGENSVFQSNEQLFESRFQNYVQGNNTIQKNVEIKSADEILFNKNKAKESTLTVENLPTKQALENEQTEANIGLTKARTAKEYEDLKLMQGGAGGSGSVDVNQEKNEKTGFFGKRMPISGKDANGNRVNIISTSTVWRNGKEYYQGNLNTSDLGYVAAQNAVLNGKYIEIPVDSYNKAAFNATLNLAKRDKPIIMKALNDYNNTPMQIMKFNEATPEQKLRAQKEGRKIISMSQIRRDDPRTKGISDDDLYKSIESSAKGSKVLIIK